MGTDTRTALDQPSMTAPTPKPPRDKVMRIATMTKQLLDEVHTQTLDSASLERLRTIDTHIIDELHTHLTPDLREELQRLALPLTRHTELSDADLRLAHAQLVGWLQGLLQTTHTALSRHTPPRRTTHPRSRTLRTHPRPATSPRHRITTVDRTSKGRSTCPVASHPTRTIQRPGQHAEYWSPPSSGASHNNTSPQLRQPPYSISPALG